MKILFVQAPQYMDKRFYTKKVHKRYSEGGILMPPLGMAYMASIMRKHGYDVGIIDGYAMKYDINELVEKIRQENSDILMFDFTKLTISPNTELFDEVQQEKDIDYWRKFTLGEDVNESEVRLPSCSVPDEDLDKWLGKAYRQFYFRPAYIMHRIMKLNSFAEFKELFKSALSII